MSHKILDYKKKMELNIRAFWGEDPYDNALIDLCPILINIAKEGGDDRVGLKKYRDEIIRKVTSSVIWIKYNKGIIIAYDTHLNYGSLVK